MLKKRTSVVNEAHINSIGTSSVFEIGDCTHIHALSRALAVQREREYFFGNEGHFADYDIFSQDIPFLPITESMAHETIQLHPFIKVNTIKITAIAASSVVQIGSNKHIHAESRIKHIRHLESRE